MRKYGYQSKPVGEQGREPKRHFLSKEDRNIRHGKDFLGHRLQSQQIPSENSDNPQEKREQRDEKYPFRTPPNERTKKSTRKQEQKPLKISGRVTQASRTEGDIEVTLNIGFL